jgi:cell wall-associated NlpC family hydrolase
VYGNARRGAVWGYLNLRVNGLPAGCGGRRWLCLSLLVFAVTGCASRTVERPISATAGQSVGDEVVLRAIAQIGKPYVYGGADLNGFDCSGLVHYVYRGLGVIVPRTAAAQYSASQPVDARRLLPGDLLFFDSAGRGAVTHVGIYAGAGRFVHAPQSGRLIELRELADRYYAQRLIGAGRLGGDSPSAASKAD